MSEVYAQNKVVRPSELEGNSVYIRTLVENVQMHVGSGDIQQQTLAKRQFSELVSLTYIDTYTLAYRLVGNEQDAQDIVQEAYIRAYRGINNFRGDAQFTTWLYRITANASSSYLTKNKRHKRASIDEIENEEVFATSAHIEERVENNYLGKRLQWAISQLSPALRQVVVLFDIYDQPHSTVAEELDISENTAKLRLHRARRKLREILQADEEI